LARLRTVFLDAGGVLLFPNWRRVSDTLASHGVIVPPDVLAAAEPHAKRRLDDGGTIGTTTDASRGWLYFDLILDEAGVPLSSATRAALVELHAYHQRSNLWDLVPDDVVPALTALRRAGLGLTVVSNANGTLCRLFDRLGLTPLVDSVLDSCDHGVEKPDPGFFLIALDRSGAHPDSTIHVGDLYHVDVVGARSAGLRGVLLDVAGLYGHVDSPRVRSLGELVTEIEQGRFD
jgi:HAD superfamily hydrolase (TIGR01509 family)